MDARLAIILTALGLTACGSAPVDDPGNPAALGAWTISTQVDSVEINNQRMSRAAFAAMDDSAEILERMEQPQSRTCTEPSVQSADALIANLGSAFGGCAENADSRPGALVLACSIGRTPATLRVGGTIGQDSGTVQLTIGVDNSSSQEPARVAIHATQQLQRTGDCG